MFERKAIRDAIDAQLPHVPNAPNRNRKPLPKEVTANFEFKPPLWELRVGDYRVFYEIDAGAQSVTIHAVRLKGAELTTKDVLYEGDGR
jgi:mRNA-degrading endonuclease RelE of RelBE toxin-antitoxin system